jgi:4-hydroxy-tetrahydrodipicolinate synthase
MFFEEGNPGGVKVALENREIMQQNLRLPLVPVSTNLVNRIQQEIKSILQLIAPLDL